MHRESGDWNLLRQRFNLLPSDEVDLHFGRRDPHVPYEEVMAEVSDIVRRSLLTAQQNKRPYVLFLHGHSTSRRGVTTARSAVRSFIRSKEATPLVERSGCIQHSSVFLAKIRPPKPGSQGEIPHPQVR